MNSCDPAKHKNLKKAFTFAVHVKKFKKLQPREVIISI